MKQNLRTLFILVNSVLLTTLIWASIIMCSIALQYEYTALLAIHAHARALLNRLKLQKRAALVYDDSKRASIIINCHSHLICRFVSIHISILFCDVGMETKPYDV